MIKFFLSLKVRVKLLAAFGSILLLSVLLIIFSITSINKIIIHKAINEKVDILKLHLNTLELATKSFMYEEFKSEPFLKNHESSALKSFEESYNKSKHIVAEINQSNSIVHAEIDILSHSLITVVDSLRNNFLTLVDLLKTRGFKDYGLEGSLRLAIHQVENSGFRFDKASMLTLRRHEKDFFLRRDLKYQREFNAQFENFYKELSNYEGSELSTALAEYKERFNRVVDIEKRIGLREDQGIRGRIQKYFAFIRPQLEFFGTKIKMENEAQIANTKFILLIIFSFQFILGIVMALLYANVLVKSIKEIRTGISTLANGNFPSNLTVKTSDEIGQTKLAFNQFMARLKSATEFAEKLGNGELHTQYEKKYGNDVLAQSLVTAQHKLLEAEERQSKINWMNAGVAQFNEIIKHDTQEIEALSDQILRTMIHYVNANQGAIYLSKKSKTDYYLEQVALYAYAKKKITRHSIAIGEGLAGQCFLEGETIYIKDIPKDFVRITSGLGEATPRNVLITPLKIRSQVIGIIELASFQILESHQIAFIEQIAESIGNWLSSRQSAYETKLLLEEFRQRESSLAKKEETLRKEADDQAFVRAEMERQRADLQQEIVRLKHSAKVMMQN